MATFTYRIQMRRDSASDWTSNDPTLAEGELGWETDTDLMKRGDGSTAWTSLSYWPTGNFYIGGSAGVGTESPATPFHLVSNVDSSGIRIQRTSAVVGNYDISIAASDGSLKIDEAGVATRIYIEKTTGDIGIEESAPDAQFCINQGAADDNILSGKSSDVAHGYTTGDETDTYYSIKKADSAGGGFLLRTYTDGSEATPIGVLMQTYVASTADTTSGITGQGLISLYATQHDGANNLEDVAAGGNVFIVRTRTGGSDETKFIIKGNGDILYDGSAAAFDGELDAMACHDLSQTISHNYNKVMEYSKDKLVKLGVMSEDGFISIKNSRMLELGAIGELYKMVAYLLEKMGLTYEDVKEELTEGNNGDDLRSNNRRKQRGSKNNQKN